MIQVTESEALGKGRLRVCFDNGEELVLYRTEAHGVRLTESEWLSEEDYGQLLGRLSKRATKRAMYLLEQMDRTERQLREKLTRGGYPKACIDEAVAYVKRFGYLDDVRYACNYVRYSQERVSRQKLFIKLAQKGVDSDTIERAIEEEYEADETAQIRKLLAKRKFEPGTGDDKEFRRTYQYLLRRGFLSSDVLREMRRASL